MDDFSAEFVPRELAQTEWEERFYHMRIKRLGPTLMAAEDWLPVQQLGAYQEGVSRLGKSKKTKLYSYGTFVNSEKMTIFTAYRADSRQGLGYIVAMALTGSLHRIAIQLGGQPYSVGFWNTPYLPSIYSQDTLNMLKKRKQQLDPGGILNTGKHYEYPTLLPPLVLHARNRDGKFAATFYGAEGIEVKRMEKKFYFNGLEEEAMICGRCGYCRDVCPAYKVGGWESFSPRGKIALVEAIKQSEYPQKLIDRVYQCTLCGACREACHVNIDTREMWIQLRQKIAASGKAPEGMYQLKEIVMDKGSISREEAGNRTLWAEDIGFYVPRRGVVYPEKLRQAKMIEDRVENFLTAL